MTTKQNLLINLIEDFIIIAWQLVILCTSLTLVAKARIWESNEVSR